MFLSISNRKSRLFGTLVALLLLFCEDSAASPPPDSIIKVSIEIEDDMYLGPEYCLAITLEGSTEPITGFNFLISYESAYLSVLTVEPGEQLTSCGWEYFNYRFGPFANCEGVCPSGLLRITATADTEDGNTHPNCLGPTSSAPIELTRICFIFSTTRPVDCRNSPVSFYWNDCSDNVLTSLSNDTVLVANDVYDYSVFTVSKIDDTAITVRQTDSTVGFPTYYGIQNFCLVDTGGNKPNPKRIVDYYNGGRRFFCLSGYNDGDINCNGFRFEISDAVLYTRYFIEGLAAFNVAIECQITASDVNGDGVPLTVRDLVYLIRIIIGDEIPRFRLIHNTKTAIITSKADKISTDIPLGAALFTLQGKVEVGLLADGMEMMTGFLDGDTRVIIYSMGKNEIQTGPIISTEGEVISVEVSDYYGAAILVADKATPTDFTLLQNYPNPFNPRTTISFETSTKSKINVTIYDILGRIVRIFSLGELPAGNHSTEWDGTGQNGSPVASGVYFYELRTGTFIETKKMVLLK